MDRNYKGARIWTYWQQSLSARRAWIEIQHRRHGGLLCGVALRKESVDRNPFSVGYAARRRVALRKESVDRNGLVRVWNYIRKQVALRKESVDRNLKFKFDFFQQFGSLSARRAWIEIQNFTLLAFCLHCRSPQGERG